MVQCILEHLFGDEIKMNFVYLIYITNHIINNNMTRGQRIILKGSQTYDATCSECGKTFLSKNDYRTIEKMYLLHMKVVHNVDKTISVLSKNETQYFDVATSTKKDK